ncbi:MAG: MATE family efflux transporter [Oscillospiraceae bacterium]|nr:MATE family efflux transporter [Oscillospiraceae bacterium]
MVTDIQKSDFSKGSVPRAIMRLAIPMTLAQLVNVLYSVISKIYLGRLPGAMHLALSGVGVALPVIFLIIAVPALCGTGGGPLFAISRGKGEDKEAEYIMGNAFTMLLILGALATALVLIFRRPLLFLFGASYDIFPFANEYLTIYSLGSIFVMITLGMNVFINAQGFGRTAMMTVVIGASVNLVLEPIFIFALGMGVRGAALSTVIAQFCSAAWVMRFLVRKSILRLKLSRMKLLGSRVRRIMALGLSGFIMSSTNSLAIMIANIMLSRYGGDMYVGIMAVINSLREVIFLPISGIERGASPVISFNYGAGHLDRVRRAIKFKMTLMVSYATVAAAVILLIPGALIGIFNSDPALIAAGIPALRLYFGLFTFMSAMMSAQAVFIGLGRAKNAIFFSLLRKVVILSPLMIILPTLGLGAYGVFLAEPISHVIGGIACVTTMYFVVLRKLRTPGAELE